MINTIKPSWFNSKIFKKNCAIHFLIRARFPTKLPWKTSYKLNLNIQYSQPINRSMNQSVSHSISFYGAWCIGQFAWQMHADQSTRLTDVAVGICLVSLIFAWFVLRFKWNVTVLQYQVLFLRQTDSCEFVSIWQPSDNGEVNDLLTGHPESLVLAIYRFVSAVVFPDVVRNRFSVYKHKTWLHICRTPKSVYKYILVSINSALEYECDKASMDPNGQRASAPKPPTK